MSEVPSEFEAQINAVMEAAIRPALQRDGGDIEVVAVEDKLVRVRLTGMCGHCPHAMMTIKGGIERFLREKIDEEIVVEPVLE